MSVKERFKVRRIVADNLLSKHEWHRYFAWRPIRITRTKELIWLKTVYRRALYKTYSTYDERQQYEYGTILDVLASTEKPRHQGR